MNTALQRRILVMMSAFNGERYIGEQIDSILNQKTEYGITLRIRDDGSTDGTREVIRDCMEKHPGQIEMIEGENIGVNAGFFSLLRGAAGFDYYALSDQDDIWLEDKLQTACDAIDGAGEELPLLYSSVSWLIRDDGRPYGVTRKKTRDFTIYNTIIQNICPGHNQVMNQRLLDLLQVDMDPGRLYVHDAWITNVACLHGRILFDNQPHTLYRQSGSNQMGYGSGQLGRLMASGKRTTRGEGRQYRRQVRHFIDVYRERAKAIRCYDDIHRYAYAETLGQRIAVVRHGRFYRQSRLETLAFYLAYVLGAYRRMFVKSEI